MASKRIDGYPFRPETQQIIIHLNLDLDHKLLVYFEFDPLAKIPIGLGKGLTAITIKHKSSEMKFQNTIRTNMVNAYMISNFQGIKIYLDALNAIKEEIYGLTHIK